MGFAILNLDTLEMREVRLAQGSLAPWDTKTSMLQPLVAGVSTVSIFFFGYCRSRLPFALQI